MHSEIATLLSSTFGRLVSEQHPISHSRKCLAADHETQRALWRELADGGWLDAGCQAFQEEYGAGTLLMGELVGRALLTLPYGASAFLISDLCERHPALRENDTVLDLAQHPASVRCDENQDEEGWIDAYGPAAQYLRLSHDGNDWYLRRYDAQALVLVDGLDPCVRVGRLQGEPKAQARLPVTSVAAALQRYLAFQLAHMLGAAAATLDTAVAYAKEREQFGRPIGQFQAIKHPLVNAWMGLDNGRYAIEALLLQGTDITPDLAATAQRLVTAAAKESCRLSIQVHGGIGFSWEHDAQLYLKRVYRLAVEVGRMVKLLQH